MERIQQGYEIKLRALLRRSGAGKMQQRAERFLARAQWLADAKQIAPSQALAETFRRQQRQIERWSKLTHGRSRRGEGSAITQPEEDRLPPALTSSAAKPQNQATELIVFLCDAGLGGLARWLRAACYMARWVSDIDDAELLKQAQSLGAILVTADSGLMERRLLRDGQIPAIWVPASMKIFEQLEMVLGELHLPVKQPRCMKCGGELHEVDKHKVAERIPPRTYRWLDHYFVCWDCGQLFWHGTHWFRIEAELQRLEKQDRLGAR